MNASNSASSHNAASNSGLYGFIANSTTFIKNSVLGAYERLPSLTQPPSQNSVVQRDIGQRKVVAEQNTGADAGKIATIAEACLSHTDRLKELSSVELCERFNKHMKNLKEVRDSHDYGLFLRQAEETIVILEQKDDANQNQAQLTEMRREWTVAFQKAPAGMGILTQAEVDFMKSWSQTPVNVICKDDRGVEFRQPSVSVSSMQNLLLSFGYSKIMHSRAIQDFDGQHKMCDVFKVGGIDLAYGIYCVSYFRSTTTRDKKLQLDDELSKLRAYFITKGNANKMGYEKAKCVLISALQDTDKSKVWQEQGFQICIILDYPQNDTNSGNMIAGETQTIT